jgi:hypothetical protein
MYIIIRGSRYDIVKNVQCPTEDKTDDMDRFYEELESP